jgi:hypothetical protein
MPPFHSSSSRRANCLPFSRRRFCSRPSSSGVVLTLRSFRAKPLSRTIGFSSVALGPKNSRGTVRPPNRKQGSGRDIEDALRQVETLTVGCHQIKGPHGAGNGVPAEGGTPNDLAPAKDVEGLVPKTPVQERHPHPALSHCSRNLIPVHPQLHPPAARMTTRGLAAPFQGAG